MKWPVPTNPRPREEAYNAEHQTEKSTEFQLRFCCPKQKKPTDQGEKTRQRIKPHSEWTLHVRFCPTQECYGGNLADKLNQNPGGKQCVNKRTQIYKTESDRKHGDK